MVAMTPRGKCRHCGIRRVATKYATRGLCHRCMMTPGVREHYPARFNTGRRGVGNGSGSTPSAPCPHPPGTPEKLAALIERAEAGYALWHPNDAR